MNYLDNNELKKNLLRILTSFSEFCELHQLDYSLSGGTLLGAIRHQGFIPWDDDIDVCMPRASYERLIELRDELAEATVFQIEGYYGHLPQESPYIKMVDPHIEVKIGESNLTGNLWIDIMPVDGLPSDCRAVARVYDQIEKSRNILCNCTVAPRPPFQTIKNIIQAVMKGIGLENRVLRKITQLAQQESYEDCDYVGAVSWGLYGEGERIPKHEFEKKEQVLFEGRAFNAMSCWDFYLTGLYGDYMSLPPIEKRKDHGVQAYYTDRDQ